MIKLQSIVWLVFGIIYAIGMFLIEARNKEIRKNDTSIQEEDH